jgi:hypothetical protein
MEKSIKGAKDRVLELGNSLKSKFPNMKCRFGCVCFRDPVRFYTILLLFVFYDSSIYIFR